MTTSAFCSRTSLASAEIFTPQGASLAPITSPRSRPAFAGSLSMAPQISIACFSRMSRAVEAPIGPTPNWMARIFFFTMFSDDSGCAATRCAFLPQENLLRYGNLQEQANKEMEPRMSARPLPFEGDGCPDRGVLE